MAVTPVCPRHDGEPAVATCKRCGTFMCQRCAQHGVEDRCVTCRPKRSREEREERRQNAVRRAPFVRCEGCGYEGPRFDKVGNPTPGDVALGLLVSLGLPVIGLLFFIASVVRGYTTATCPRCDSADQLWPWKTDSPTHDPAFDEATRRQAREWFTRRWVGLVLAISVGVLASVLATAALVGLWL